MAWAAMKAKMQAGTIEKCCVKNAQAASPSEAM